MKNHNLDRLMAGNARYVSGETEHNATDHVARRRQLSQGQAPFAVVLGCSDSRVPVELVFDQGLGDLFVIRVAGNLVDQLQIASIEFAVATFGVDLVLVLGHTYCGAVQATIDTLSASDYSPEQSNDIVERIKPAVAPLLDQSLSEQALVQAAVRCNALQSQTQLTEQSDLLRSLNEQGKLQIACAEYNLETGAVSILDDHSHTHSDCQTAPAS